MMKCVALMALALVASTITFIEAGNKVSKRAQLSKDKDQVKKQAKALLAESAVEGDLQGVLDALEAGADVNAMGDNGWTALHGAAYNGRLAVVNALLAVPGIDVYAVIINATTNDIETNDEEWMALYMAREQGNQDVVDAIQLYIDTHSEQ